MAQATRSIPIRCWGHCGITVGRRLHMLSRRTALQLMRAIPASLRPLLTISEILLSFAYSMAASISVLLSCNRGIRLHGLGRLHRDRAGECCGSLKRILSARLRWLAFAGVRPIVLRLFS